AAQVRRAFEDVLQDAAHQDAWLRDHPPTVEWWGAQFLPARTPTDAPIVTTVQDAYRDATGAAPTLRGMPYGADMRLLVHQGQMPTILFGPGDIRVAHAPDEFVPIDDLLTATRVLALTILRFCGTVS
ncbi:MAG: M20/M25/M40 family metallo-hydrolase, partial [Bacteroidetes bacterium]|nr:M20/M25/M40 family metallo-hydrolase [Bacteroidota bacterium]